LEITIFRFKPLVSGSTRTPANCPENPFQNVPWFSPWCSWTPFRWKNERAHPRKRLCFFFWGTKKKMFRGKTVRLPGSISYVYLYLYHTYNYSTVLPTSLSFLVRPCWVFLLNGFVIKASIVGERTQGWYRTIGTSVWQLMEELVPWHRQVRIANSKPRITPVVVVLLAVGIKKPTANPHLSCLPSFQKKISASVTLSDLMGIKRYYHWVSSSYSYIPS